MTEIHEKKFYVIGISLPIIGMILLLLSKVPLMDWISILAAVVSISGTICINILYLRLIKRISKLKWIFIN